MKDLKLERLIQVTMTGALLVSATACAGKERRAAKLSCQSQQECDPGYFKAVWGTMSDCIEYYRDEIDELESESSAGCFELALELTICSSKVYSDRCSYSEAVEQCADEIAAFEGECTDEFYDVGY